MEKNLENPSNVKRVIWAVDPFSEIPEPIKNAGILVESLSNHLEAEIEPVYVLRTTPFEGASEKLVQLTMQLKEGAEQSFNHIVGMLNLTRLTKPKFLTSNAFSLVGAVRDLIGYATEQKADLIIVGTHARQGVSRFFLGSFAETLLLESPIPVLVANPKMISDDAFANILFPTDFSAKSQVVFRRMLPLVRQLKGKLWIFHKAEEVLYPIVALPTHLPAVPTEYLTALDDFSRELREKGRAWRDEATATGIDAHFVFSKAKGSVSEAVSKLSVKLPHSLILMASQTGSLGASLLGSVTRQLVRTSPRPVMVFHAQASFKEVTDTDMRAA